MNYYGTDTHSFSTDGWKVAPDNEEICWVSHTPCGFALGITGSVTLDDVTMAVESHDCDDLAPESLRWMP